jgi:hypothetical protein
MQQVHTATPTDDSHRTRMTREAQADRRRKMSEMVRDGRSVEQTALVFSMSISSVQLACRIHNVDYKRTGATATPVGPTDPDATAADSSTRVQSATSSG